MNDPTAPQPTPAGWYPDPEQAGTTRYWDGSQWTDQRAPAPPTAREDRGAGALVVVGYITAFVLPIIGFIIGIILLVRRQTGHGLAVFLISIAVGFAACAIAVNSAEDELDATAECLDEARTAREINAC
jgi:Protein of unknown function (DUF2510)